MGMYTELAISVELTNASSDDIDHIKSKWTKILNSGGSDYFTGWLPSAICHRCGSYYLTVWTNIKNYDDEIQKLLLDISAYIDKKPEPTYVGHMRYEEDMIPSQLFSLNGDISIMQPNESAYRDICTRLNYNDGIQWYTMSYFSEESL